MAGFEFKCPCGACTVSVSGEPTAQLYCHCDDCQASAGAPFVARALYPPGSVTLQSGEVKGWTYKTQERFVCANCGVMLYSYPGGGKVEAVNASLLPEGVFQPQMHIQCKEAVMPVKDALPHFAGWGPMAGDSEQVDW